MGEDLKISCSCGYTKYLRLGVGFGYPEIYKCTMEMAQKGEYGREIQRLLKENPQAALDPSFVALHCRRCNYLSDGESLSLYLPKPGYDRSKEEKLPWSTVKPYYDIDYVSPSQFRENYRLLKKYEHRCPKCEEDLEELTERVLKESKLRCPRCEGQLKIRNDMMWD